MRNVFLQLNCGLRSHHESWNNQAIAPVDSANMVVEVGMAPSQDMQDIIGVDILGSQAGMVVAGRKGAGAYGEGLRVLSCNGDWAAYYLNH